MRARVRKVPKFTFRHIPEGARFDDMPLNGFGLVLTSKNVKEVYFKCSLGKYKNAKTIFVAIGDSKYARYIRWWYVNDDFERDGDIMYFSKKRWIPLKNQPCKIY